MKPRLTGACIAALAALCLCRCATTGLVARVTDGDSDRPLAAARVTARNSDIIVVTDERGLGMLPREFGRGDSLTAAMTGYVPAVLTGRVLGEKERAEFKFTLFRDRPRAVLCRVVDSMGGRPLDQTTVTLLSSGRQETTGPDGTCLLFDFPHGLQTLVAQCSGCVTDTATVRARGGETTEVRIALRDTATVGDVEGAVLDADSGTGVVGARVGIADAQSGAVTDSAGHYLIEKLPAGQYWLIARAAGYQAQKIPFRVLKGWTVSVNFRLQREAR